MLLKNLKFPKKFPATLATMSFNILLGDFKKLEESESEKPSLQLCRQLLRKIFNINLTCYGNKICQS